jgi:hypothetical protein
MIGFGCCSLDGFSSLPGASALGGRAIRAGELVDRHEAEAVL